MTGYFVTELHVYPALKMAKKCESKNNHKKNNNMKSRLIKAILSICFFFFKPSHLSSSITLLEPSHQY
jgi:hypothetical protein